MKKHLFETTDALAEAIKKGAHRKEMQKGEFLRQAVIKDLSSIQDPAIDALVAADISTMEEEANE